MRALARVLIGIVFGILFALVLIPAVAAFDNGGQGGPLFTLGCIVLIALFAFFAPTIRRAFGRSFLALGAAFFFLPISAFLLSGRAANEVIAAAAADDQALAAAGAGLAGMAVTGVATFFGLILGAICLVIGLVLALGGRREVIVIERAAPANVRAEPTVSR